MYQIYQITNGSKVAVKGSFYDLQVAIDSLVADSKGAYFEIDGDSADVFIPMTGEIFAIEKD